MNTTGVRPAALRWEICAADSASMLCGVDMCGSLAGVLVTFYRQWNHAVATATRTALTGWP
ncbi:MAG: hypothetical protein JWR85_1397, partial [Marmoricola sp.]|nr:hypothetical protein [Marmoricola sp.]